MSLPRPTGLTQRNRGRVMIESLEKRQLLTTIAGGGFTLDGTPIATIQYYKDADNNVVKIAVGGNAVAEFIAGYVDENTNALTLGDLAPMSAEDGQGADLFQVYVTQGDENSYIAIAKVTVDETRIGPMEPFTGALGSGLKVLSNEGEIITINAPEGSGPIYLGARTKDVNDSDNEDSRPILAGTLSGAHGVRPAVDDLPGDPRNVAAGLVIADQKTLGTFAFGGTVTGRVNITGNIETFYAGWLLTGNANNDFSGSAFSSNNFTVSGDARNIISMGAIGTDAVNALADNATLYQSRVDFEVGGTVGQIVSLTGGFTGKAHITHSQQVPSMSTPQVEVEDRQFVVNNVLPFEHARLGGVGVFNNDTFATAQYLGTISDPQLGPSMIDVSGTLEANPNSNDLNDYYAVSLMAGQTYTVQLYGSGFLNLGVYDPTGRLIATDYSDVDPGAVNSTAFQFKADRPGVYRLAVGLFGDLSFNGSQETLGDIPYRLVMGGAGDIALGGLVTAGDQWLPSTPAGSAFPPTDFPISTTTTPIEVDSGDLGAVVSSGTIVSAAFETISVSNGNLRAVEAAAMGRRQGDTLDRSVEVRAPNGSVGLLHTTAGIMLVNAFASGEDGIGGDFQVVDSAGTFGGSLIANRGIGTVRAGDMAVDSPPVFMANADGIGADGIIDLIDCDGNFGTLQGGGPVISTGPGGNVRYIRVGGEVYQDGFFGGGDPDIITYQPGESVTFTDDSGALMTFSVPQIKNPAYDPSDPTSQKFLSPATLSARTYAIRGSGGVVVIDVSSTGGVNVTTTATATSATAEIGRIGRIAIITSEEGQRVARQTVTTSPYGRPVAPRTSYVLDTSTDPIDININGTAVTDVLEVVSAVDVSRQTLMTHFGTISNTTGGEIVNVTAASIGTLYSRYTLGLSKSHTGAAVEPIRPFSNVDPTTSQAAVSFNDDYPLLDQRTGVYSQGDVITISSGAGMGNIVVGADARFLGDIVNIFANSDRFDIPGVFEGINGPILAGSHTGPVPLPGHIFNVNIGEGIAPSGNGEFAHSGVFAWGPIDSVTNQGLGSDIRGTIASYDSIGSITLNNGSIINARIMVVTDLNMGREGSVLVMPTDGSPVTNPTFFIGSITTTGMGGIIGARIAATAIGPIRAGGFGILDSDILVNGPGVIGPVTAAGYGARSVWVHGGAMIQGITATGSGALLPATMFTPSVRQSEMAAPTDEVFNAQFDPFSGQPLTRLTDLHAFLGTSAAVPSIPNVTDTGVLEDVFAQASQNLGPVSAYRIRSTSNGAPLNNVQNPGSLTPSYSMQLSAGNSIASIRTRSLIDGLQVTTGRIGAFLPATDVFRLGMIVAGPIGNIVIRGSLANNSFINAIGANGVINSLVVANDLVGSVFASGRINRIVIGNNLIGDITIMGQSAGGFALGNLQLGGGLKEGSLIVNGSVGSIVSAYSLGSAGDQLQINGNIMQLWVGTKHLPGAAMNADVTVAGNIGVFRLNGQMAGSLTASGSIGNLVAVADAATGPNVINNNITAGVNINAINIVGGNVNGNITAGANIGRFMLVGGSLNAGTTLLAQAGNIGSVLIRGGNLYGSVSAPNGFIGSISADGAIGNGVTALTIDTQRLNLLQSGGSILSGVTATVGGPLMNLVVNGNVGAGATIIGAPIYRRTIRGVVNGTIIG